MIVSPVASVGIVKGELIRDSIWYGSVFITINTDFFLRLRSILFKCTGSQSMSMRTIWLFTVKKLYLFAFHVFHKFIYQWPQTILLNYILCTHL